MRTREAAAGWFVGRAVDHGPYRPVPAIIEEQVDRGPDRPALSYAGRTLTYRQVDELANGVAYELAERGVRRGDVVPVMMVNSLELPLSYLALMKLGAAFVPIDPAWPADRLRASLDVLSPRLVLSAEDVNVDAIGPSTQRPAIEAAPDELVYGVFTSGTTGTPKCAMNVHRGLTNRFRFMTRYFRAAGADVVLQNSKHTFDSSLWQLFWPMTTGGHAVVPVQGEFLDLEHTIDTIATYGVTMTDFVPGILNALVSIVDDDPEALGRISSLRHLVVGGEEIGPRAVHRLRELLPGLGVTNGYGPSEASIGMVFHRIEAADGDRIPLGLPIDNCYAVVVDERLHALPRGVTGEIAIGGACLGTGYFGDPQRTAQAFVPNPFPQIPGDLLYRTGDFGYVDRRGRLFFAGRRDQQVKVGGVRIELGEIELAAQRCSGVRRAKALVTRHGTERSVAVVAAGVDGVTVEALRAHLAQVLPRTSLPRYCFVLPELPLTDTGKVDRRALQRFVDSTLAGGADASTGAPAGIDLLAQVTRAFRAALGAPPSAADADFMALGGDSIRALSVVLDLRAALGVIVGVQDLFTHPTAAALAALLEQRLRLGPQTDHDDTALMESDAALPADIEVRPAVLGRPPDGVLVTGATGFVGTRVVHQLLASTDVRVLCLCRAADHSAARARVIDSLRDQGLWRDRFAARLAGCAGDLDQPGLGLDPPDWARIAAQTDVVLHNGALVNFLFDYRTHRPANVLGTAEMLRLAMTGRPKPLHHVSTLGVLDRQAMRHAEPLAETFDPARAIAPASGYSRSKWVAERMLVEARRRGASVTIWRLGEVMPAADNGYPNRRALTHLLLTAFQRLGACPDVPIHVDYSPVDQVAARLVGGLFDREVVGRTLHVFHPDSVCLSDVLEPLERVPEPEFLARLRAAATDPGTPELATLLELVTRVPDRPRLTELLVDNPRLFRRDECQRFDVRRGVADEPPGKAIEAYRRWLAGRGSLAMRSA